MVMLKLKSKGTLDWHPYGKAGISEQGKRVLITNARWQDAIRERTTYGKTTHVALILIWALLGYERLEHTEYKCIKQVMIALKRPTEAASASSQAWAVTAGRTPALRALREEDEWVSRCCDGQASADVEALETHPRAVTPGTARISDVAVAGAEVRLSTVWPWMEPSWQTRGATAAEPTVRR